jgi:hypothetical protein
VCTCACVEARAFLDHEDAMEAWLGGLCNDCNSGSTPRRRAILGSPSSLHLPASTFGISRGKLAGSILAGQEKGSPTGLAAGLRYHRPSQRFSLYLEDRRHIPSRVEECRDVLLPQDRGCFWQRGQAVAPVKPEPCFLRASARGVHREEGDKVAAARQGLALVISEPWNTH